MCDLAGDRRRARLTNRVCHEGITGLHFKANSARQTTAATTVLRGAVGRGRPKKRSRADGTLERVISS